MRFIPVSKPQLGVSEFLAINRVVARSEISGLSGSNVQIFESEYCAYLGVKHSVAVNSGTSAIFLALLAMNVGPGDEVLVSSYTNMASFFPILQLGATPIPVDVEKATWNIDPELIENKITDKTKAILVVHIFGLPADMPKIQKIATKYAVPIVEDCAEAHGAKIQNQNVGTFGEVACFSFYGNKLISAGEGGLVATNSAKIAERIRSLRSLGFGKESKFLHEEDGYNFRMSNLHASIARVQLRRLDRTVTKKRLIARTYLENLSDISGIEMPVEPNGFLNVYWMFKIVLDNKLYDRDIVTSALLTRGVETRPGFIPFSDQQKVLQKYRITPPPTPIASYLGKHSFYLPSGPDLSGRELRYVITELKRILRQGQ